MSLMGIIIFLGIALVFMMLLKMNLLESMILTVSTIMLLVSIGMKFHFASFVVFILTFLGFFGFLFSALRSLFVFIFRKQKTTRSDTTIFPTISLLSVICVYLFFCILYKNDFIQHVDELHLWALAPKYMFYHNRLPGDLLPISQSHSMGICYFSYFFLKTCGYSEWIMYVSTWVLTSAGIMLPFTQRERKCSLSMFLFFAVFYVSLYSIYFYGSKNCYVDIPLASWAGGLMAWIELKKSKKKDYLILIAGIVVLYQLKGGLGLLLSLFVVAFYMIHRIIENKETQNDGTWSDLFLIYVIAVILLTVSTVVLYYIAINGDHLILLPRFIKGLYEQNTINNEKIALTTVSFLKHFAGYGLALGKSNLQVSAIMLLFICFLMLYIRLIQNKQMIKYIFYSLFWILVIFTYCIFIYYGYIFTFSYYYSINTFSCWRYLSILCIMMFVFTFSLVMASTEETFHWKKSVIASFLLILFLTGINPRYLSYTTAFDKTNTAGYDASMEIKREADIIRKYLNKDEKVYFIDQSGMNPATLKIDEYTPNVALFNLLEKTQYFISYPWMFNSSGMVAGVTQHHWPTIYDLPNTLKDGNFRYIWIYKTDEYLIERFNEIFQFEEEPEIINGQLYRVIDTADGSYRLELVENMIKYEPYVH